MIQASSKLRFLALIKSTILGFIIVAADLSIGMAAQNNAIVTFPGASNELSAPNKRLLVRNIETGTLDDDEHYTLFLDDLITKQSQKLVGYGRTIDVAWAPDSKRLFVTNWIGSNVADCEVFDVKNPSKIHSVLTEAAIYLRDINQDAHIYASCIGWLDPNRVKVQLSGHEDIENGKTFEFHLIYNLKLGRVLRAR